MQLAILQLGSLVKWTVAHVARNLVAITHRSFARWKQLRLPSLQVHWQPRNLLLKWHYFSGFGPRRHVSRCKQQLSSRNVMLNLMASLNRVCWQLIVILSCQVHVWRILLTRNALHENSSSVVTGVERIWLFCSQ